MKCPKCQTDNLTDSKFCRECATPLPLSGNDQPSRTKTLDIIPDNSISVISGSIFAGRYQVVEELGRGGMGVVYRAYDSQLKEEVALKIIKPEIASEKRALERFSIELKLARRIVHRNVCRVYELMEYQGVRFLSMEYVRGEDLKSFIRRARRLDIGAAVAIAIQVCEGLAEAHRLGVVHRDLKPGNILIDKDGNAKIMDFGIARSLLEEGITGEGGMVGTPEYISPEQLEGEAATPQSDLHALGVILFEMVCGTYPFEGDTARIIAQKIQGTKPPDPKTINPHVPDDLANVILKCLEKRLDRRYGSAGELLEELRRIENDLPTAERVMIKARSGILTGITEQLKKRKALGAVVGLAVVAFAVGGILLTRRKPEEPKIPAAARKPTLAVLFFANRTNDPGLDVWKMGLCTKFISIIRQLSTRGATVISESNIYSYLRKLKLDSGEYSADDLGKIAEMSNATYILTGKLMKVGERWQIYYELEDAAGGAGTGAQTKGGATLASVNARSGYKNGKPEELDTIVASLAEQVVRYLRIPVSGRVKAQGSSSGPAMQNYAEARDIEIRANLSQNRPERDALLAHLVQKYQAAIEADPRYAAAYWGLGDYYDYRFVDSRKADDFSLMKKNYELAYKLDPQLAGANAGLGWVSFFEERPDDAYAFFLAAARSDPEDPDINSNVGSFLCSIGQIESGIRYFTKAIESGDTSVSPLGPYYRRTRNYLDIDRLEEAEDDARTMIALEPDDVSLRLLYARVLAKLNKRSEAERELARAEELDPARPDYLFIRTYLYAAAGEKERALPVLEKARKENPFWLSYFLAENYARLGMKDDALAVIGEGIKSGFSQIYDYLFPYQVLKSDAYEKVRSDPRFQAILESQKEKHFAQLEKYGDLCEMRVER
jgi:tetratricopeptide (TPR) repeat protein/predicted Ser/Thr protein kinase